MWTNSMTILNAININVNVNVTDTILWQCHHDRVMQLNLLNFCGICQMMPLKVWPNTALGCNNQSICLPRYSLYVQLLWYPMYYPGGMKARVSTVQWSKPHSILAPLRIRTRAAGLNNHKRWPLHYHCTQHLELIKFLLISKLVLKWFFMYHFWLKFKFM